jgi:hypothetical protein
MNVRMFAYIYCTCFSHSTSLQVLTHVVAHMYVCMYMYDNDDTNQAFPTQHQTTFLMSYKFTCYLPVFASGRPNACDKRTRNITTSHLIVNTVQKKLNKRDVIQQTAAGMRENSFGESAWTRLLL